MKSITNEKFISTIQGYLPEDTKLIFFLMNELNLSKDSAYRRLHGTVPYTFEEITKMSTILGFSIDEILKPGKKQRVVLRMDFENVLNPEKAYMDIYEYLIKKLDTVSDAKNAESIIITNHLLHILINRRDTLFKLFYYKLLHQTNNIPPNLSFSELIIPEKVLSAYHMFTNRFTIKANHTYTIIIDTDLIKNIIDYISYFYATGLLSNEEVLTLKKELLEEIECCEQIALNGYYSSAAPVNIYLSSLDIDSTCVYTECDNKTIALYWTYPTCPIRITSTEVCKSHKQWLLSLKKYTTLISGSNEMLRSKFFNNQRKIISNIDNL